MSGVVIRDPRPSDAEAIASLMGDLGYDVQAAEIPPRLQALQLDGATSAAWVAELDGRAIGLATARVFPAIHQPTPVAWLTVLVVAESARGLGIGKRLVGEAEAWAKRRGAGKIALTSALHRVEAHDFYKRLGYEHTGVRLARELSG